jgi:hypothetical protein
MNKVICPHCNKHVSQGNFCELCGGKMVTTCDCWKTGEKSNCGFTYCPTNSANKSVNPGSIRETRGTGINYRSAATGYTGERKYMKNFIIVPALDGDFLVVPVTEIAISLEKHCIDRGASWIYPSKEAAMEAIHEFEYAIYNRNGRSWLVIK